MTVHVDEVHTDVVPTGRPAADTTERTQQRPPGAAEDVWRAQECELAQRRRRVAAEAFDD